MEFLTDISMWIGLITLVILEIVLGVDNLVFIAILSEKLPKKKRERACIIGLTLALIMRIALLSFISWIATLTKPLCKIASFLFSGRDLILLFGGVFLLFKATTELHQQLEYKTHNNTTKGHVSFWVVVIQIVVFDAIFSLDAVITAVGTVDHVMIMIIAVIIAVMLMLLASRLLINFINSHQTVIVLCLSFLLIIGFSLVAEGMGFYIPKGYLYVAIGFSVLIELFNQIAHCNSIKNQSTKSMRERTAEAIMKLMGGNSIQWNSVEKKSSLTVLSNTHFAEEERHMITGVLSLASRTLRSIMTPRNKISWLDSRKPVQELYAILMETPHNMFPVCNGELDQLIGIVRAKDLMTAIANGEKVATYASESLPIVVPETLDVLNLLEELRRAKGSMVIVSNEFGIIQGLITPLDVLEAIAGEFPDEDETPEIKMIHEKRWLAKGSMDLHALQQALQADDLAHEYEHIASLAGLLLFHCDHIPKEGDVLIINEWRFIIRRMVEYRIELVEIEHIIVSNINMDK